MSQKVAQNERTMFAFLNSNDDKGLKKLLENDFLIGLDKIYDYFEENFRFLNHESLEYRSFFNTKRALDLVQDLKEIKIIKTLGIIEIYNKFSEIKPSREILKLALNLDKCETEALLKELQEKNIIFFKRNKGYFKIAEDSEINIETEIKEYIQNKLYSINYTASLNKYLELDYYYPVKYNYEKDITRYFKQIYLDASQIDYLDKIKEYADGRIVYLTNINNSLNYDSIKENLKTKDIILITNQYNKKLKIDYILKELEAIDCLILNEKVLKNISIKEEYLLYKEELISIIKSELKGYFLFDEVEIFYKGKVFGKKKMLELTYDYLIEEYPNYIEINYELMNKEKLSIPMKKVRTTLLDMLLKEDENLENDKFYENTGAINSVARTVLKKICFIDSGKINLNFKWRDLEKVIIDRVKKNNYSIEELYIDYTTKLKGYGLRAGIFTLFLGIVLIKNKNNIFVIDEETKMKQILNSELIEKIEKTPKNYYLTYIQKTIEQEQYLENLKELLGIYYSDNKETEIGIIEGLKNYFYSINRFLSNTSLKNCKVLPKIFNSIFQNKNSHEFLFEELLVRAKTDNLKEVIEILAKEKNYLEEENMKIELKLKEVVLKVLKADNPLEEALKSWQEETKTLDNGIKIWLKKYIYRNDRLFLIDITTKIKGFSYENWSSFNDIEDFKERLEKFITKKDEKNDNQNKVVEVMSEGERLVIPLLENHSQMGKLLKIKLEATIKAMGMSVKDEEKRSILLEILKNM